MRRSSHYIIWMFIFLVFVVLPKNLFAQEETESPLPIIETTDTVTSEPLSIETQIVTEPPVLVTEVVSPPIVTVAPELTPETTNTVVVPEATAEITENAPQVNPEATSELEPELTETMEPTPESTAVVVQPQEEPELTAIVSDAFIAETNENWTLGAGWQIVPSGDNYALQGTGISGYVIYNQQVFSDVVVEALVQIDQIAVELHVRQSEIGSYLLTVSPDGLLTISRGDMILASTNVDINTTDQWNHIRFSVIGYTLRVAIDGVEVMVTIDSQPLPRGLISFKASPNTDMNQSLLVDNVRFWVPTTIVSTTPTPTESTATRETDNDNSQLFIAQNEPPESPSVTECVIDLMIVIDESSGNDLYEDEENFAIALLSALPIDIDNVLAGVGYFASLGTVPYPLTYNSATLIASVEAHEQLGGFSDIALGIASAQNNANGFGSSDNRDNVPDVMVVVTDGFHFSVFDTDPVTEADNARAFDTILYTVAPSHLQIQYDEVTLNGIANDPDVEHVFIPETEPGGDGLDLDDPMFIQRIASSICTEEDKPNYDTELPSPSAWTSGEQCTQENTSAALLGCSENTYEAFYTLFSQSEQRTPTYQDLLAVVFDEELGDVYGERSLSAFANNYLGSCGSGCDLEGLLSWLASKQGWYVFGGHTVNGTFVASPNPDDIVAHLLSIESTVTSSRAYDYARRVFEDSWNGGYGPNVPFDWGNWKYESTSTSAYQSIITGQQPVVFCRLYQGWIANNDGDPVRWHDYIFAVVTYLQDIQLPGTSVYSYVTDEAPLWLSNPASRETIDENEVLAPSTCNTTLNETPTQYP